MLSRPTQTRLRALEARGQPTIRNISRHLRTTTTPLRHRLAQTESPAMATHNQRFTGTPPPSHASSTQLTTAAIFTLTPQAIGPLDSPAWTMSPFSGSDKKRPQDGLAPTPTCRPSTRYRDKWSYPWSKPRTIQCGLSLVKQTEGPHFNWSSQIHRVWSPLPTSLFRLTLCGTPATALERRGTINCLGRRHKGRHVFKACHSTPESRFAIHTMAEAMPLTSNKYLEKLCQISRRFESYLDTIQAGYLGDLAEIQPT